MPTTEKFYKSGLMDLSGYHLEKITSATQWDECVELSSQGTLFNCSTFINALNDKPALWGCVKGSELKGVICLFDDANKGGYRPSLVIYNGPILKKPDGQQAIGNQFAEQFRVVSVMTRELANNYQSLSFQTHSTFADLRPFLWHNYDTGGPKFNCTPRFTSTIALEKSLHFKENILSSPLYLDCSKSRRQEIRYALKKEVKCTQGYDWACFQRLYVNTFERQGVRADELELSQIKSVCDALYAENSLKMYIATNKEGDVGSIAVFGFDSKRAYYLYGCNSEVARDGHTGSYVLFSAFQDMLSLGVKEVDLEGVNSPLRGHFKMSFGGSLATYYSVKFNSVK